MRCVIVIAIMIATNLPQSRSRTRTRLISLAMGATITRNKQQKTNKCCLRPTPPMLLVYLIIIVLCDQHIATQAADLHRPKFRIIEEDALARPPEQRLALQIMIMENNGAHGPKLPQVDSRGGNINSSSPGNASDNQKALDNENELPSTSIKSNQHAPMGANYRPSVDKLTLKRPYDLENVGFHNGHFRAPTAEEGTQFFYSLGDHLPNDLTSEQQATTKATTTTTTTTRVPLVTAAMNQRSELIRTQHRPPWFKQQQLADEQKSKYKQQLMIKLASARQQQQQQQHALETSKRMKFKLSTTTTTTMAPAMTSTEFFKLISSAHSPIKIDLHKLKPLFAHKFASGHNNLNTQLDSPSPTSSPDHITSYHYSRNDADRSATSHKPTTRQPDTTIDPATSGVTLSSRSAATMTTNGTQQQQKSSAKSEESRVVMAPELLVTDDEDTDDNYLDNTNEQSNSIDTSNSDSNQNKQLGPRRHLVNYTIKSPTLKKPVTIVRHSGGKRRRGQQQQRQQQQQQRTSSTTESPSYLVIPHHIRLETTTSPPPPPPVQTPPERVIASSGGRFSTSAPTSSSLTAPPAPQLVRLIAKQKHKYDDNITSPPLTVIDNDAFRLPPNTTAVHGNRLIVRIKPGKGPSPARFQVTTEYPYYNPVAGITPPYPAQPTTTRAPYTNGGGRPTSASNYTAPVPGQPHYGYVRPGPGEPGNTPSRNGSTTTTFGSQNIRFPAPAPTSLVVDHSEPPGQQQQQQHQVAQIPERLNVSVPSDANIVGPNRVPDRLVVETDERPSSSDSSAGSVTAISDATIVARPPYGTQVHVSQDGIMRLTTTRRPHRYSTTKRINIVSANTTVITADPDQLSDVLSSIEGSHHTHHHRPVSQGTPRPSILASIGKIFNASVATTAIALMTLIKTILIAVLVMFLPPIALTAAIVQAVSMG